MNVQQNRYFVMCNDQKRQYCSLPPKVIGNVCGFLTLKVGRIVWCLNSYKNVVITVGWWGESNPQILRPYSIDGDKYGKIGSEIIYEIRTDPKTFEQYLRDCESLEFNVINEEVNIAIGKVSVPDLASITAESRYEGCFSIIDENGYTAGDIYIALDLYLLQKCVLKEISHQNNLKVEMYPYTRKESFYKSIHPVLKSNQKDKISDLQNQEKYSLADLKSMVTWFSCDDDDDDDVHHHHHHHHHNKALKKTSKKRTTEKTDSELNDNGIHKDFYACLKEATPPDIGGTVWHHEALKQANSICINILSLSLNHSVMHQENTNMKNFKSKYNSLHRHIVNPSLPTKAAYFVEYEIPALLNISASKSDISRNSCPWNSRIIRFCSRKQLGSEVYFGQSSMHHLPRRNGCWLENVKDLKIVMKVFLRNSNQRTPLQIGKAALEMCNVMNSESLSFSSETPVFSLAQVPHPFCIGKLRTKIELGRDCRYFGKEFFRLVMNRGSSTVKKGETKKSEILSLQETDKEVFEKDAHEKEQQEQNKENLLENDMKQQYVEKPLVLYALLYISRAQGFNVMNSYLVSKSFCKEDIAVSNICWETSSPNYNLRELVPVLLSDEFLERCHNNFLIVEAWERKPVPQNDALIGISKLPLNQFFVAFRSPLLAEQLIQAKYPVVGVNGWVNVFNPVTRLQAGQLHAVLCLGTEDQIQLFERVHGIMETNLARIQPYNSKHYDFPSFAPKAENFTEVSVSQCQFSSDPKQILSPSNCIHRGDTDESGKEVPLDAHQQNKINHENTITIKNYNQNVTNQSEALLTKPQNGSFVPNMNASPHILQQNVSANNSIQNHGVCKLSRSPHQESEQERNADQILDKASGILVAENAKSNKQDADKQQLNLGVTKVVNNCMFAEQTCPMKNQQCQTDVFVLDLQHYDSDFLTKHSKNIESLIIKLSSRGFEIIEMNEHNANAEILDTTKCHSDIVKDKTDEKQNQLQLAKNVTFLKHHAPQLLTSAGQTTYAFSISGDKEHDMLTSGDDPVVHKHDNRGDSDSIDNHNSARNIGDVVDNDHKIKSVDIERESKTAASNGDQNSMKQQSTSAANGITNSKKWDCHLTCNMSEFMINTDQAHVCNNYFIPEDQSEAEKDHTGDFVDSQRKSMCVSGSNNVITDKYDLNKHTMKPNISEQPSSFCTKKSCNHGNTAEMSSNAKQELSLSRNETNRDVAHNHFKTNETPLEVSDNAQLLSCAHVFPEYSIMSAHNNFCAHIAVHKALNLSLSESDEAGRNVYVSFHLNYGCAKVIVDGEVQLRTGLLLTPVVPCNGNPVWDWHCEAWLPSDLLTDTSKQLTMKIWQKSNKSDAADPSTDILLGVAPIDLTVVLFGIPWISNWFNIVNFKGSCVGQIKVSVKPQENLDRFRPNFSTTKSLIDTSILQNINYLQAANSRLETRERYHANVQTINCNLPERLPDRKICSAKHTKTASKAFVSKHEKNIPLEWDLDSPEDATFLLTNALRQKLSELDEITKRLKRRLLSVTTESVSPTCLVWEQEEAGFQCCVKSNEKQNSITDVKNCAQMYSEANVDLLKGESYNATQALLHRSCCCTQLSTKGQFQHSENVPICHLKHLDHSSNMIDFSESSNFLDNETSYEQLQSSYEKISEYQLGNRDMQCNGCNADLEKGEKDLESNNIESSVNKDNDMEDFDALTDVLMETAIKELDIASVFNPLLFQHLLLSNTNLIQRKYQRDKYNKHENVHSLLDSRSGSEIMLKYDEPFLTISTMKNNVSCTSKDNTIQGSEKLCHTDLNSIHAVVEMDKFKKLRNHIVPQKQPTCQKKLVSKRDLCDVPEIKELSPLAESSNIEQSSLNTVQCSSNLEKQCKPQLHHQLKIPINGLSYVHEVSINNTNEVQEKFSELGLSGSIESNKEEIQNCSKLPNETRKQKLLQGNVKEVIEVINSQAKSGGCCSEEYPPDLQRKRKQNSRVCRLAPLFFQKLSKEHE